MTGLTVGPDRATADRTAKLISRFLADTTAQRLEKVYIFLAQLAILHSFFFFTFQRLCPR